PHPEPFASTRRVLRWGGLNIGAQPSRCDGATPYGAKPPAYKPSVRPVTREDVAEAAEDGPFAAGAALLGSGGVHAAGKAREGQGLEPDAARARERGQECALAAEQHGLDAADAAHVHIHAGGVADHAAGVHVDALARGQLALDHRTAGMHEDLAAALQLLHDEALAAEQAGEDLLLEVDADGHATGRAEEAVLLAD